MYRDECGCVIIAANPDCGPMPGNPTRGQVAWATQLLPELAAECKANARLIAAAPEMLAALKGIVSAGNYHVGVHNAAKAAIAKAEGK